MLKAFGQPSNLSENDHQLQEGLPLYLSLFPLRCTLLTCHPKSTMLVYYMYVLTLVYSWYSMGTCPLVWFIVSNQVS